MVVNALLHVNKSIFYTVHTRKRFADGRLGVRAFDDSLSRVSLTRVPSRVVLEQGDKKRGSEHSYNGYKRVIKKHMLSAYSL